MKRVMIAGFLAIVSSIWAIVIGGYVQSNLVSDWYGSRFWASASELGVMVPMAISLILLALSLVMMGFEYFRKDEGER